MKTLDAKDEKVLIVAAHPDDEVLGCGGVIARHADQGSEVRILIIAEGATSRLEQRNRGYVQEELYDLNRAATLSCSILGAHSVDLLNHPDNRLDSIDRLDLIKVVEERIKSYKPSLVYVHHVGDLNIDHRRLHEAVVTACRPVPGQPVKRLLSFEVPSSSEWQTPGSAPPFLPSWFVDISSQLKRKKEALEAYTNEMRAWPHARSIEAVEHLARWRGSQVGVEAAEAFCLLRQLE